MLKGLLRKFIPKPLLLAYHKILAVAANILYWFPSRKLVVVGVTGTKGKSSTVVMITRILEEAGFKVGSTNTIFFKIADKEWPNTTKQGMPGRFRLQKMLRQMARAGCTHAVIEVTSEGILQSRQWGIAFDVAIFTNLSPEHIESHGSYEAYRNAKAEIFKNLAHSYRKQGIKKVIVASAAEKESEYMLQFGADEKYVVADRGERITLRLIGDFMRQNALLAIAAAESLGVGRADAVRALEKIASIPGRAEQVAAGQDFSVLVDYAHEPRSFAAILSACRALAGDKKVIVVFGVTGGGRDKAKRPSMGRIAAEHADYIVLTTDDPYDDDPAALIADIVPGIVSWGGIWKEGENWWRIADRRVAIEKAIELARTGDVVAILGKGSESVMAVAGGIMVPWSDVGVARNALIKRI